MRVGVPREIATGERRVALVPETVGRLEGIDVVVEPGAGTAASFVDDAYLEAGASPGDPWDAEVVVKVARPSDDEVERLREGQVPVAFLQPLMDAAVAERRAARGVHRL